MIRDEMVTLASAALLSTAKRDYVMTSQRSGRLMPRTETDGGTGYTSPHVGTPFHWLRIICHGVSTLSSSNNRPTSGESKGVNHPIFVKNVAS